MQELNLKLVARSSLNLVKFPLLDEIMAVTEEQYDVIVSHPMKSALVPLILDASSLWYFISCGNAGYCFLPSFRVLGAEFVTDTSYPDNSMVPYQEPVSLAVISDQAFSPLHLSITYITGL